MHFKEIELEQNITTIVSLDFFLIAVASGSFTLKESDSLKYVALFYAVFIFYAVTGVIMFGGQNKFLFKFRLFITHFKNK